MHPRQAKLLLAVCLINLATLWACRLPKLCVFDPQSYSRGPVVHQDLDLSRADAPFIAWPLARVCRETSWNPDLVFICDNNSGGIGNIRNYILTCLRYSISAGATGLMMPRIRSRSEENLAQLFREYKPFSYFFDEPHFRQALKMACPQMMVYDDLKDVPGYSDSHRVESITPNHYGSRGGCDRRDLNRHVDLFGSRFQSWLGEPRAGAAHLQPAISPSLRLIRLNWGVQWDYPVYKDGPEFVATFGGLLRFRKDILQLGEFAASAMRTRGASLHKDGISSPNYIGFHLRTENDALKGWPDFSNQTSAYLKRSTQLKPRAAYLATGNSTEASKFKDLALSENGLQVFTKKELFQDSPKDLEALEALSWDQQSLIDFVVLLQSEFFMGVSPSSFSMNVALKRHLKVDGLFTRPWKIGGEGDGRSWLVGNYDRYWEDWLFMFDSMWP